MTLSLQLFNQDPQSGFLRVPTGLLLINLGTPDEPTTPAVRRYLREFLSDPRVIDINPVGRALLLHGVILRTRPAKSAHAYRQVWDPQRGSPLLAFSKDLAAAVSEVSVSEDDDPRLSVELTDVDYESVLERARGVDNEGNRRRTLRQMVWEQLGVREESTLDGGQSQSLVWRGRRESVLPFLGDRAAWRPRRVESCMAHRMVIDRGSGAEVAQSLRIADCDPRPH